MATTKQVNFLRTLVAEREIPETHRDFIQSQLEVGEDLDGRIASDLIGWILEETPKPTKKPQPMYPEVEAGRYAIDADGGTGFYRVDRPTEGKWAGYVFVKRQYGGNYERVPFEETKRVLAEIAQDPKAAAIRYGHESGACSVCGRELTDPESVKSGIGPVCAKKRGW